MKKVLFVASVASHIKSFHLPYLKMLKENGYEVHVAAKWNLDANYHFDNCDYFHEISIERNPIKINNLKAIYELKKIIDDERFDLIHCHTPMGAVAARLAAKKARKKYGTRLIYTAHGFHFFKGAPLKNWMIFYPVEWFLSKFTDTLITINHEDEELAKKRFSKRCKDIRYVPGVGVDLKKFNIDISEIEKNNLKKSLKLNNNSFVLTCVARLDKNKNQSFLIECMEKIVKEHDDIHLLLVGRDELNGYYQSIVKEKKLEKNIHFLGNRDDVPELLHISNVVVSASKREGLPVNVIEAFACKLPVVALPCRGMKDLLVNGRNGYLIEGNSKQYIKLFIDSILNLYNSKFEFCDDFKYDINDLIVYYSKIYFDEK